MTVSTGSRLRTVRDALTPAEWGRFGGMGLVILAAQRARLGDLRLRDPAAPLPLRGPGPRDRGRVHRLDAGRPARLRRRSHLRDRQHHPQAHVRREAAARHRVLLRARPLHDHRRRRDRAVHRGPGRVRRGSRSHVRVRDHRRGHRHLDGSGLPVPDRGAQRGRAGRDLQGVPRPARGPVRRGRARAPAAGPRHDVAVLRPVHALDHQDLAHVLRRADLRDRLRHRHRGPAARRHRRGRHRGPAVVRGPGPAAAVRRAG